MTDDTTPDAALTAKWWDKQHDLLLANGDALMELLDQMGKDGDWRARHDFAGIMGTVWPILAIAKDRDIQVAVLTARAVAAEKRATNLETTAKEDLAYQRKLEAQVARLQGIVERVETLAYNMGHDKHAALWKNRLDVILAAPEPETPATIQGRAQQVIEADSRPKQDLAEAMEITPDKLSKILSGTRSITSLEIALLSNATQTNIEWLIYGTGEKRRPALAAPEKEGEQ